MNQCLLIAANPIAITAFGVVFFARHSGRDLVVAFVTVNVGVLAVASVLGTIDVGWVSGSGCSAR